ncbi:hypothetical protein LPJ66_006354 [Kickxella alabastrina]|uniref:Uncharacterized protein n=1 Tax=Kickxella alabastrina TaxID=61397 RepID=A0ACC1IBU7_9FUNG|nr:hypothetical protein LPJ66_006354 [Kickxella alabastrina]
MPVPSRSAEQIPVPLAATTAYAQIPQNQSGHSDLYASNYSYYDIQQHQNRTPLNCALPSAGSSPVLTAAAATVAELGGTAHTKEAHSAALPPSMQSAADISSSQVASSAATTTASASYISTSTSNNNSSNPTEPLPPPQQQQQSQRYQNMHQDRPSLHQQQQHYLAPRTTYQNQHQHQQQQQQQHHHSNYRQPLPTSAPAMASQQQQHNTFSAAPTMSNMDPASLANSSSGTSHHPAPTHITSPHHHQHQHRPYDLHSPAPASRTFWNQYETGLLVKLWLEFEPQFTANKRNAAVWAQLAERLTKISGRQRVVRECRIKWKNMWAKHRDLVNASHMGIDSKLREFPHFVEFTAIRQRSTNQSVGTNE